MITSEQLHEKLKHVTIGGTSCRYPKEKCDELTPLINRINKLKKEKNAGTSTMRDTHTMQCMALRLRR